MAIAMVDGSTGLMYLVLSRAPCTRLDYIEPKATRCFYKTKSFLRKAASLSAKLVVGEVHAAQIR